MRHRFFFLLIVTLYVTAGVVRADSIERHYIMSQSIQRSYYLYVPETLDKKKPAPIIVMLHGSGDSGYMPVSRWMEFARREGIVIVGPNALDSSMWRIPEDAPQFIHDLVKFLRSKHNIDDRRVYLFGHSGGAIVGLYLGLLQSEYFAAVAVHAGAMQPEHGDFIARTKRKIPISLFVGTNDPLFPVADVRQTRDMLTSRGFTVELNEIKDHTHDYGRRSNEINPMIWNFFKQHRLEQDQIFQHYRWDE